MSTGIHGSQPTARVVDLQESPSHKGSAVRSRIGASAAPANERFPPIVRLGFLVEALLLGAYLVTSLGGWVDGAPSVWLALAVVGYLIPAALCVRAASGRKHRIPAVAFAVGGACWGAGFAVFFAVYEGRDPVPVPSIVDGLWMVWYGLVLVAMVVLAWPLLRANRLVVALDVLVGTLAAAALSAAFLYEPILRASAGEPAVIVTSLAYPTLDLAHLAIVLAVFAATGFRPGRAWLIVGAAMTAMLVGDVIYSVQASNGSYVWGTPLEVIWPGVQLALAYALWARGTAGRGTAEGNWRLVLPVAGAAVAVAVLVMGNLTPVPLVGTALAVGALMSAVALTAVSGLDIRRLRREVVTDPLTGLANHPRFHDVFASEVLAAQQEDGQVTILLGDLDGFKDINDRLGHAQGDEVLRQSARVLREVFGQRMIARLGNDEFGVVLPATGLDEALELAGRAAMRVAGLSAGLGISWGGACHPTDGPSPQLILVRADVALYEAKRALGRSQGQPVEADELQRRQLEAYARDVRTGYARERRKARDLDASYIATVRALAGAVEAKDDATGGHIHRVHDVGLLLAAAVCPEDLGDPQLAYAFLLHDIGKLKVPDSVLTKPGPLDDAEWELMRRHPEAGVAILEPIPFLGRALGVVRHHHERWDGTGYPSGLAGEEIPIWARVFAVVDTIDAITADRPYRKGRSYETALEEVIAQSGRQFDPACVAALVDLPADQIRPLLQPGADMVSAEVVA